MKNLVFWFGLTIFVKNLIMELTREIYEKVVNEYNEYSSSCVDSFLNYKFPRREGWFYDPNDDFLAFFRCGVYWGWGEENDWFIYNYDEEWLTCTTLKPAPKHLVIERVGEELDKKGYHVGAEVKCLSSGMSYSLAEREHANFKTILMFDGEIWMVGRSQGDYGVKIMGQGKWAEILEPKPQTTTIIYFDENGERKTLEVTGEIVVNKTK